jgi:hypothetical protein
VYALGKFDGSTAASQTSEKITTGIFGLEMPAYILDYCEIEILIDEDVGSQRMFNAKILQKRVMRNGRPMHHVHLLEYLQDFKTKEPAPLL